MSKKPKSIFQCAIAYLLSFIMSLNGTTGVIAGFIGIYANFTVHAAQNEILDGLKRTYDLDNPERNHTNTDQIYQGMTPSDRGESTAVGNTINKVLSEPVSTNVKDLSGYFPVLDASAETQKSETYGLAIGSTHGTPTLNEDGALDVSYTKQGTRQFTRDSDNKLVIETVTSEVSATSLGNTDLYGYESERTEYQSFKADTLYGKDEEIAKEGKETYLKLKDEASASGRAFQTITEHADKSINAGHANDRGWLNNTYDKVSNFGSSSDNGGIFGACQNVTSTQSRNFESLTKIEHTCTKNLSKDLNTCELERTVEAPIQKIMLLDSSGKLNKCGLTGDAACYHTEECGDGCLKIVFGKEVLDKENVDQWVKESQGKDDCDRYQQKIRLELDIGKKFTTGKLTEYFADDHARLFVGDNEIFTTMLNGKPFPETSKRACGIGGFVEGEPNLSFNIDNNIVELTMQVALQDKGFIYMAVELYSDQNLRLKDKIIQKPAGCLGVIHPDVLNSGGEFNMISNGYTKETIPFGTCTFDNFLVTEEGSRGFHYSVIDHLSPLFPTDTGNASWKANLSNYRCDPMMGEKYCTISPETGEEICMTWDEIQDIPNRCEALEQDDTCSLKSSKCTEGWTWIAGADSGTDDLCFNQEQVFECVTDNSFTYESEVTTNVCSSTLPCAGGECSNIETESNSKFVSATVHASIIQNSKGDMACEVPDDPQSCTVFPGEQKFCSWDTTGLGTDCCEVPAGVDVVGYISMTQGLMQVNAMAADGLFGSTVQGYQGSMMQAAEGAYTYVADGASAVWKTTTEAMSSAYNSLVGNATGTVTTAAGETVTGAATEFAIGQAIEEIKQQVYRYIYDALPDQVANLIFSSSGSAGAGSLSMGTSTVGTYFGYIMWAYMIYQLIKLALTLLTACEPEEMDMGVKIGQSQCYKVGASYCNKEWAGMCYQKRQDYCCYNSVLAKIIMQQGAPQLGKDVALCEGLTMEEIAILDFDQIDLSEWYGLLVEAGRIPSEAGIENLTGEGRMINSPDRQSADARSKERLNGMTEFAEEAKDGAKNTANNIDCSGVSRPPVCEFGFDVRN